MEIKEVTQKVEELAKLRKEKAAQKLITDEIQGRLDVAEAELLGILETEGLDNFNTPSGKISKVTKISFTTPKTLEDKQKFVATLRSIGGQDLVDAYITFNSAAINSWANTLIEQRKNDGDLDCDIPGLGAPKEYYTLSFRGGK